MKHRHTVPVLAGLLCLALTATAAPASATLLPSDSFVAATPPASPAAETPVPTDSSPALEETHAPAIPQPTEVPGRLTNPNPGTAPAPVQAPEPVQTFEPEQPAPAQPSSPAATPNATESEVADPTALTEDELAEIIGILGAKMGQGLDRLEETQDPQSAGGGEIAERLEAEEDLIISGLADPALATEPAVTDAPAAADGPAAGPAPAQTRVPSVSPALSTAAGPAISLAATWMPAGLQGMDVSSHQPAVNWSRAWNQGSRFAYVKATEATSYKNPLFSAQYRGATSAGMLRGAYHFAIPNVSTGAAQANYFVDNGGGWSADGNTLPPLLDIEYNPYPSLGNTCYNMSAGQMVAWIRDFSQTVSARTGRLPMIYTTTDWWRTCTGNSSAFAGQPLHIAAYNTSGPGPLPNGWSRYTLWQYSSTGPFEGDSNVFQGSMAQLRSFAGQPSVVSPGQLYYRTSPVQGLAYGNASDQYVTCDWDGDGVATAAAFRNGIWYIRNTLTGTARVAEVRYGDPGDQPICGDWDGNGQDSIGVFRNGMVYLKNSNTSGVADGVFAFGDVSDTAIVGDWDGDGYDTLGVARSEGVAQRFYLSNSNIRPAVAGSFLFGNAGDTPVSGDWNNDGFTTVGVLRGSYWYLTDSNIRPTASSSFQFGNPGDYPLTGRWQRGGGTSVGVAR